MRKLKRFRRNAKPRIEVTKARRIPGGIQVKVKMPMENVTANSNWMKMHMKYYWRGEKKFRVAKIHGDVNDALKGAEVRIPQLEKEHRIAIRKQQRNMYRRY